MTTNDLIGIYDEIDIDLRIQDIQYQKYSLLTFDPNHMWIYSDERNSTIVDNRLNDYKYLLTTIPDKLLSTIEQLITENLVGEVSFSIEAAAYGIITMEELNYGSIYNENLSLLPNTSLLYSEDNYQDQLWIHHDENKQSISFEEIKDDFEIVKNGDIKTQLVHLVYFQEDGNYYIEHIDHEFIFYKYDEYIDKEKKPRQKGYAKEKTFKIDNARIPFNYSTSDDNENQVFFIRQVLDVFFTKKELIAEYFQRMNS